MVKMKKFKLIGLMLCFSIAIICLTGFTFSEKRNNQSKAHEIAEIARSLGLNEDDAIIVRAQEIWWENENNFRKDVDMIATTIYNEAWGGCSTRHRELVAAVIVNRVNSSVFPNTVYGVLSQAGQYDGNYTNPDSYCGQLARADKDIWTECQRIATRALKGEVDAPTNVLYQAEFVQGVDVYEIHHTGYSTTYFCFG